MYERHLKEIKTFVKKNYDSKGQFKLGKYKVKSKRGKRAWQNNMIIGFKRPYIKI